MLTRYGTTSQYLECVNQVRVTGRAITQTLFLCEKQKLAQNVAEKHSATEHLMNFSIALPSPCGRDLPSSSFERARPIRMYAVPSLHSFPHQDSNLFLSALNHAHLLFVLILDNHMVSHPSVWPYVCLKFCLTGLHQRCCFLVFIFQLNIPG